MAEDWQHGGFGLYVHWPYCEAKCPYCDFNSHVVRQVDHARWAHVYELELDRLRKEIGPRVLNSIFFGGGTPSLMNPDTVARVIAAATHHWTPANDIEITLEANPTSVERAKFTAFGAAGVNRLSMGIQALNDKDLARLGRRHSRDDALAAFDIARQVFGRVSFDLIYARQDQALDEWQGELNEATDYAVDHLSLYQLTIEPETAFGKRYALGRLKGLPSDDLGADMYDVTQRVAEDRGFPAYEVSNHAAPGAESRHNMIYWTYGDYAGIGPGAHGRLTRDGVRYSTEAPTSPTLWLDRAEIRSGSKWTALSRKEQATEFLLMGMRLYQGVNTRRFTDMAGEPLSVESINNLQYFDLVEFTDGTLRATKTGMPVLNAVLNELLTE